MRSTQLVIFLVLLNTMTFAAATVIGGDIGLRPHTGGSGVISDSQEDVRDITGQQSGIDEFIGSQLLGVTVLSRIYETIFFGPEMLKNIGVPAVITDGFVAVLTFVFAFDIAEFLRGGKLS